MSITPSMVIAFTILFSNNILSALAVEDVSKFELKDVKELSKGSQEYDDLAIIREDKYNPGTLITVRQGPNATLFKLKPGEAPIPFAGSLMLTKDGGAAGDGEGQVFRYIIDVAQYSNNKFAMSEYLPDHCVKEFDSNTNQITNLIGSCDQNQYAQALAEGETVLADQFYFGNPTALLILENSKQLLTIDGTYKIIYMYKFENKTLELFLPSWNIAEPLSLLSNSDESIVYISHHYAVTAVRMTDRTFRQLVGKNSIEGFDTFEAGPFGSDNTHVGALSSLRWIVTDKLMVASHNNSLALLDLTEEKTYSVCKDVSGSNSTAGSLDVCKLNQMSGLAVSQNTIYVSTSDSSQLFALGIGREEITCCQEEVKNVFDLDAVSVDSSNICIDNANCEIDVDFGSLTKVDVDWGNYKNRPIDVIQEDRYNPGTFFINARTTIKRFVPGQPVTLVVGNETQVDVNKGYRDGNASVAEFSLISGFVQFNQTKMAIADFQNGCVRLYDSVTGMVSTIVGTCDSFGRGIVPSSWDTYDENTVKDSLDAQFSGVLTITLLEKWNKLLVLDNAFKVIIQNDFVTEKTRVLDVALARKCPRPLNAIADREENNIYINHAYGVSRYNLHTKEITLLTGMIDESANGDSDIPLVPGPFQTAQTGGLDSFSWLIRDQVLVSMGRMSNEAIVIIDLRQEQVYSICNGNKNLTETIPGALDVCKLNTPTGITVTSNDTIMVASLNKDFSEYSWNINETFLWELTTEISKCLPESTTGNEIISPNDTFYFINENITVSCPKGYAINGSQERTCGENNQWTEPLPNCIELTSEDAWMLSPTSGQLAGGTVVTVSGLIPDDGVSVLINGVEQASSSTEKEGNELMFKMPEGDTVGTTAVIFKVSEDLNQTFSYAYLKNPSINAVLSRDTIESGGLYIAFNITNVNSSNTYTLNTGGVIHNCLPGYASEVKCELNSLQELNILEKIRINMTLLSDGIDVFNGEEGNLIVYPDPQFVTNSTIGLTDASNLVIPGTNLALGDALNAQYRIGIVGDDDVRVNCKLIEAKNNSIQCQPDPDKELQSEKAYHVQVTIGNLPDTRIQLSFKSNSGAVESLDQGLSSGGIAGIIIGLLVLVITVSLVVIFLVHKKRQGEEEHRLYIERVNTIKLEKEGNDYWALINMDIRVKLPPVLVKSEKLKITKPESIGEGNFGKIYQGELNTDGKSRVVAIKTLKADQPDKKMVEDFLTEALMLQGYGHANVLETLGVSFPSGDLPKVILPFMGNGDLKSVLKNEEMELTFANLMDFALQIASGMEYLSAKKFVHRDLAARNCLVDSEFTVKIADFGLSKDVYERDYYRRAESSQTPLPIKWMALESLRNSGEFSSKSDVWSYGVLVWEICTRGSQPYSDVNPWDTRSYLEKGRRLPKPTYAPDNIYEFMLKCWVEDPDARPTFTEIHTYLSSIVVKDGSRVHIKDIPSINYVQNAEEVHIPIEEYLTPISTVKAQVSEGDDHIA